MYSDIMYESDDDVLIIEETPPRRGSSADAELPAAKRARTEHENSSSQLPDQSSGTAVGHGGAEVQLVTVNNSGRDKGKYPARAAADEQQVKNESQPRQYDFQVADFYDLLDLQTEQELDEYAAGGPNGASSSRSIERRTQKVAAYRRFLAAQQAMQQPQQQGSASNSEGPIEIDLDIPDSQEEEDAVGAADDRDLEAATATQPAARHTAVAQESLAVPPAAERPAVQQQQAPASQQTQAQQQPQIHQQQQQQQRRRQRAAADDMEAAEVNARYAHRHALLSSVRCRDLGLRDWGTRV